MISASFKHSDRHFSETKVSHTYAYTGIIMAIVIRGVLNSCIFFIMFQGLHLL